MPHVQSLARRLDIQLQQYQSLEDGKAFETLPDNSFDVVLFCETLEHITFNPVALWTEIYRVLAPGGRIVITTPNYYGAYSRLWDIGRLLGRFGGGIPVEEILCINTYGHHWKGYSLREIALYFKLLSTDFTIMKTEYVEDPRPRDPPRSTEEKFRRFAERNDRLFRWGLHVEVELTAKKAGIQIVPNW